MTSPTTVNVEELKRAAAEQAATWIEDRMILGLGTGSTVRHLLDCIAERRRAGELGRLICIPTSSDTAERAASLGITLSNLTDHPQIDLTIDGADEVDPELNLIKGLGGALLREKIAASASRALVIMVDEGKLVARLGERAPLPVEVDPFGAGTQHRFFRALGADASLRQGRDGNPFLTDGGNYIYDCRFAGGIADPRALGHLLNARPGIAGHGLFLGMADAVVVAGATGTRVLERSAMRQARR